MTVLIGVILLIGFVVYGLFIRKRPITLLLGVQSEDDETFMCYDSIIITQPQLDQLKSSLATASLMSDSNITTHPSFEISNTYVELVGRYYEQDNDLLFVCESTKATKILTSDDFTLLKQLATQVKMY